MDQINRERCYVFFCGLPLDELAINGKCSPICCVIRHLCHLPMGSVLIEG